MLIPGTWRAIIAKVLNKIYYVSTWSDSLYCFILDLDGTVYNGKTALPHAAEFISRLNADGSGYVFFTNSPENSRRPSSGRCIPCRYRPEGERDHLGHARRRLLRKESGRRRARTGQHPRQPYCQKACVVQRPRRYAGYPDYVLASFSDDDHDARYQAGLPPDRRGRRVHRHESRRRHPV